MAGPLRANKVAVRLSDRELGQLDALVDLLIEVATDRHPSEVVVAGERLASGSHDVDRSTAIRWSIAIALAVAGGPA